VPRVPATDNPNRAKDRKAEHLYSGSVPSRPSTTTMDMQTLLFPIEPRQWRFDSGLWTAQGRYCDGRGGGSENRSLSAFTGVQKPWEPRKAPYKQPSVARCHQSYHDRRCDTAPFFTAANEE
jgi:hypothetical protein